MEPQTIEAETRDRIIYNALLTRRVEESLLNLFSDGRIFGTIHTCIGQEFSSAIIANVQKGDTVFSSHRNHGHFLARTNDVEGLIAEVMGKSSGACGGFGGSQNLCGEDFFSSGIQGGMAPIAAGLAFAKSRSDRQKNISLIFVGDGTLGSGVLYETLNIASKWRLPILFVLENNLYAQSTPQIQTLSGSIASKAAAFDIEVAISNTWDWQELFHTSRRLIEKVRHEGPAFLQVDTYRLAAHSKGDDPRDRTEIASYEKRDPLLKLLSSSLPEGARLNEWDSEIRSRIERVIERCERESISEIQPEFRANSSQKIWSSYRAPAKRFIDSLREGFAEQLELGTNTYFIGEDIESPYGGAFKATLGLSIAFANRVLNTPISEAAITGMGIGMALGGLRPVVEIMFGDFSGLAFDQLVNHAAKFPFIYNRGHSVNLIVRTPMGGHRSYGPTHSQTLDRHFLGVPGLRVLALNPIVDPAIIYKTLLTQDFGPTFVVENKTLYSQDLHQSDAGFEVKISNGPFPIAKVEPQSDRIDVTLFGYGGSVALLLEVQRKLFDEHDLIAQILAPTEIYPFDVSGISNDFGRAPLLVLVEEGQDFAGFNAEVIAQLGVRMGRKMPRVLRIGPRPTPIPASRFLEQQALPNVENVVSQIVGFNGGFNGGFKIGVGYEADR